MKKGSESSVRWREGAREGVRGGREACACHSPSSWIKPAGLREGGRGTDRERERETVEGGREGEMMNEKNTHREGETYMGGSTCMACSSSAVVLPPKSSFSQRRKRIARARSSTHKIKNQCSLTPCKLFTRSFRSGSLLHPPCL